MTLTVIGFRTSSFFFPCNCISPLCVMKFTHILKAWLAYILYWHSGNMFSLSLSSRLFLSFPFIFRLLPLYPRLPFPRVGVALWSSAVLFSVIFICRTRGRHIAAIIYSKEGKKKKTQHFHRQLNFSHFILHFRSSTEPVIYWCTVRRRLGFIITLLAYANKMFTCLLYFIALFLSWLPFLHL